MCTFVDRMVNLGIEQGEKRGMECGMAQGTARGKMELFVHQITKKWNKNQSVPEIAEALEEEEARVERIVELLEECGSDNTEEVVMKALEYYLVIC